jgi:hypothetical protein
MAVALVSYALAVALVAFFAGVYLVPSRFFPSSDEWTYVAALREEGWGFFRWTIAQFADHRIPLQKLIQFAVLRASDFDFRYLVGLNVLLSAVIAILFLEAARLARGSRSWGDCIIPLLFLGPANGPALSGFQFQFLSSVLALSAALLLGIRYAESGRARHGVAAIATLVVGALCGLSGLTVSTLLLTGILLGAWCGRWPGLAMPAVVLRMAAGGLVLCLALWATWTPSGASQDAALPRSLEFAYGLLGSPFVIYSFTGGAWKAAVVLALVLIAAYVAVRNGAAARSDPVGIFLAAALLAQIVLAFAIAARRAQVHGGWNPVIGMHYGFLMTPIPVLAWMMISRGAAPALGRGAIALALILLSGRAYLTNAQWRSSYLHDTTPTRRQLANDLRSGAPESTIVDKYLSEFSWRTDQAQQVEIIEALKFLRAKGYSLYGPPPSP